MTSRGATWAVLAVAAVLAACSQHNRMYYLHRYANDARRLERDGRGFEANDYWGRASVKAESVLVRNPGLAQRAEALAVRGEALAALGQCTDASRVLGDALAVLEEEEGREYATLALARCQVRDGQADLAIGTVMPITESRDAARRNQARLLAGMALRRTGQDSAAVAMLEGVPGRDAQVERAIAEAGLGNSEATLSLVDSMVAWRDSTTPWDLVLADIGSRDPALASGLTDRLGTLGAIPADRMAEYVFADAARLGRLDTTRQGERYAQLIQNGPDAEYGIRARIAITGKTVQHATDVADLRAPLDSLATIPPGSPGSESADSIAREIRRVLQLVDSAPPGAPQGDMRRFLAAELARDRLGAPGLAASLFGSVPSGWPESPYAGKAWLAQRQLTGDTSEVGGRFESSPYLQVLRGGGDAAYSHLEDSLAAFVASAAPAADAPRPGAARVGPRRPGDRATPDSAPRPQAPGARPAPGQRVEPQP